MWPPYVHQCAGQSPVPTLSSLHKSINCCLRLYCLSFNQLRTFFGKILHMERRVWKSHRAGECRYCSSDLQLDTSLDFLLSPIPTCPMLWHLRVLNRSNQSRLAIVDSPDTKQFMMMLLCPLPSFPQPTTLPAITAINKDTRWELAVINMTAFTVVITNTSPHLCNPSNLDCARATEK